MGRWPFGGKKTVISTESPVRRAEVAQSVLVEFHCQASNCGFEALDLNQALEHLDETKMSNWPLSSKHVIEPRGYLHPPKKS